MGRVVKNTTRNCSTTESSGKSFLLMCLSISLSVHCKNTFFFIALPLCVCLHRFFPFLCFFCVPFLSFFRALDLNLSAAAARQEGGMDASSSSGGGKKSAAGGGKEGVRNSTVSSSSSSSATVVVTAVDDMCYPWKAFFKAILHGLVIK